MASKQKYYIVTMYRFGDRSSLSYLLGVYDKKKKAMDEAEKENSIVGATNTFPKYWNQT